MELKIKQLLTTQSSNEIIKDISNALSEHAASGVVTVEQLIKIKNLATNPNQLKSVLPLL